MTMTNNEAELRFPEIKTFKQEVAEVAARWAKQERTTFVEATAVIERFARDNHTEALAALKQPTGGDDE